MGDYFPGDFIGLVLDLGWSYVCILPIFFYVNTLQGKGGYGDTGCGGHRKR